MATKRFSGSAAYELVATASRSGRNVTVTTKVNKISGTGYYSLSGQLWRTVIDGTTYNDTWTYDFRNYKTRNLGSKTKNNISPGSTSWSVRVEMSSGIGSATVSGNIDIPSDPPAAPTIQAPTRNSDSSMTVRWARNATGLAPYTSQQIQRSTHYDSWGDWTTVSSIAGSYASGGNMSQNDGSTRENRVYRYRVRATNGAGAAVSAATGLLFTTPARPTSLSAEKQASGAINLTLVQAVRHTEYKTVIEYSTDGGTVWTNLVTLNAGVLAYTHLTPPSGSSIKYRARVYIDFPGAAGGNGLTSTWRESGTVPLISPPNAPSDLNPNGPAATAAAALTLRWKHNSVDTSAQRRYQVRYRIGAAAWTELAATDSAVSERTIPANTFVNGNTYEWQVRTWGADANPSAYSASAFFQMSGLPEATIITPTAVYGSSTLIVDWLYNDDDSSQSAYELQLLQGGVVLETLSGSGNTVFRATFKTALQDATEYTVRLRVRDGILLWSPWDSQVFTTAFPVPATPVFTLAWDPEQGAVQLTVTNPAAGVGQVGAVSNQVLRSYDGGQTWQVAVDNAPLNTTLADIEVELGVSVQYRVVAWSGLPSASAATIQTIETPGNMGYWNGGPGLGVAVQLKTGMGKAPAIDLSQGLHDKQLHYFAGRKSPVEFTGEATDRVGNVSFLIMTLDEKDLIEYLSTQPAPHLFRLPDGLVMYASIGPVSFTRVQRHSYTIGFTATEVSK